MPNDPRILIVDDDPVVADSLWAFLAQEGRRGVVAHDAEAALRLLEADASDPIGVVLSDLNMPGCDGIELLKRIKKKRPGVVVIMITGFGKIESAVRAIKAGASDYLTKPVVDDELRIAIDKAAAQHALLSENQSLRQQLDQRYGLDSLVGADHRMQKVYDLVEAVAQSPTTVLVEGESGTGKTMVARAIHTLSDRRNGPFVTFACGSIPETLLESELFGHAKGAFTGADRDKPGKILSADGGTLFIDEINSATPALQLKLLRVLQDKQFEPLGSSQTVKVDVRFVCATNRALEPMVERGDFRDDLYYRINVVKLPLPPLRERVGDIAMLSEHFLDKHRKQLGRKVVGFEPAAVEALTRYAWPGNVRELENAVERAVVLCRQAMVRVEDLPETVRGTGGLSIALPGNGRADGGAAATIPALRDGWTAMPLAEAMKEPERQILLAALEANQWNRQQTAEQLQINRTTLYKKIKQHHLDEPGVGV